MEVFLKSFNRRKPFELISSSAGDKRCKRYHLDQGTILCMDHEEEFAVEGIAIQVLPAWRYVLNL